jgi:hypothetical protein
VREEKRLLFMSSRAEFAELRDPGSGAGRNPEAITIEIRKDDEDDAETIGTRA